MANTIAPGVTLYALDAEQLNELARKVADLVKGSASQEQPRFLTEDEVRVRLGACHATLWRWARSGYLKPIKFGKSLRYRLADIEVIERGGAE